VLESVRVKIMVRNQKEWRGVATPSPDIVRRLGMIFLHDFTLLIYFLKHFGIFWLKCRGHGVIVINQGDFFFLQILDYG
jgi:hypothetical protein